MDRQIVYPGAIPLETDLLNTNKYAMMGLAKLAAAMMGSNTYLHGLACTPSSPASMVVNVAKGQIYSLQNVDGTAYSSLAADTTNTILKQGVILGSTAFTLTAPTTAGQSINYLIQIAYSDTDSGATVLPYYNAANPSVAYSGPNNAGTAQNTVRSGVCTVALKAGVAATTGTQTTPAADTGYTAAWVITVAQGATTITASNIAVAANAPFLPAAGIFSAVQQGTMTYAVDTGAANAYVASFVPALPTLADGMRVTFKAKTANSGASTLAVNGGSAYPLYSHANQALQGGEIVANGLIEVEWNSTLTAWVLCGNSGGALPVGAATQSNHALQLGQAVGRLINIQIISATGTYTKTAGANQGVVEMIGAGAGGAPCAGSNSNTASYSGGGGAGAYCKFLLATLPNTVACTVGSGGASGNAGGSTTFGSYCTVSGGVTGSNGTTGTQGIAGGGSGGATVTTSGVSVIDSSKGSPGIYGVCINVAGGNGGHGASSILGQGGRGNSNGAGEAAGGYGSGGGGCFLPQGGATTTQLGGAGSGGVIIVYEYA
ncbi:MAG: phage tail protein [Pantoea sp.]|uniref:phage tail protein n=1 Tax=Pantoea sp. TaxID=69393 RepID=UPI002906D32D|nr:phage tail protein [Pantoea sp.]MDU5780776.1 phage tail protein [Pantoea sp.]